MKYVIKYEYDWYDMGCGCCTDSSSTMEIYEEGRRSYLTQFSCEILQDESELRECINTYHPEYNNFSVHTDTRWY